MTLQHGAAAFWLNPPLFFAAGQENVHYATYSIVLYSRNGAGAGRRGGRGINGDGFSPRGANSQVLQQQQQQHQSGLQQGHGWATYFFAFF